MGLSDAKRTSLVVFATPESGAFDAQSAKGLFGKGVGGVGGRGEPFRGSFFGILWKDQNILSVLNHISLIRQSLLQLVYPVHDCYLGVKGSPDVGPQCLQVLFLRS